MVLATVCMTNVGAQTTKPKKSKKYITIQQNTTVNSIELEKSCTFATVL